MKPRRCEPAGFFHAAFGSAGIRLAVSPIKMIVCKNKE